MAGIDGRHRNHRIFAGSSYRNFDICALKKFQKSLLYRFSADVTLIGIFLFRKFINLIDVNDTTLGALYIVVRICKQFGNNAFHIIADITGFGKCCRIGDRKRYLQNTCEGLHQERFAASCRS